MLGYRLRAASLLSVTGPRSRVTMQPNRSRGVRYCLWGHHRHDLTFTMLVVPPVEHLVVRTASGLIGAMFKKLLP